MLQHVECAVPRDVCLIEVNVDLLAAHLILHILSVTARPPRRR